MTGTDHPRGDPPWTGTTDASHGAAPADDMSLFVLTATHDLQEPLRKIVTFVDLLELAIETGNASDTAYAMSVVRRSARHAQRLVMDLLLHAKLGQRPLFLESVDVSTVVRDVLAAVSGTISETSAVVEINVEPLVLQADRTQMFRLVLNLVSNGLKYHKPGVEPYLAITLTSGGGQPRLVVADRGIGFAPEHREVIFQPFRRLNSETETRGSGIGLTTCLAIAERHGWSIDAKSELGSGAVFTVRF